MGKVSDEIDARTSQAATLGEHYARVSAELKRARARLRAADELARCAQVIVDDDLEMGPALWPEHRALVDALDAYRNSGGEG